jgi:hypothetical protein
MATEYTANCYGLDDSRKGKNRSTIAIGENPDVNKGQKCTRLVIAADTNIMGGEIWVTDATVAVPLIATDTFTITLIADN